MLYLVATPIGNLKDITLRALEVLKEADTIACEDTRVSSKLLSYYGISKPLIAYHDYNGERIRPRLLNLIKEGKKVAYITDGGMPLISDPGYKLVLACQAENLPYTIIPGVSAPLMALCLSGLSPARFFFCGFLPPKKEARKAVLEELKLIQATLLFFESSKRLVPFLQDALEVFGNRQGAVCREMTKIYEEARKESLSSLITHYEASPPRGEIVVVIEGTSSTPSLNREDFEIHLHKALEIYSLKEAADLVSKAFGLSKREVYQHALTLKPKATRLP